MPAPRRDLGVDGWVYVTTASRVGYGHMLHGYRTDTEAGRPLVSAWRPNEEQALEDLREKARRYDVEGTHDHS